MGTRSLSLRENRALFKCHKMAVKVEMHEVCPHLIPQERSCRHYSGFISVQKKSFRISIRIPETNLLKDARIDCGWKLHHLLRGYEGVIQQRLVQSSDLATFLMELKNLLERLLQCDQSSRPPPHPKYYRHLVDELEQIGWDKVVHVDPSLTVIKLCTSDSAVREHLITMELSTKHPFSAPLCSTDLPTKFHFSWSMEDKPLHNLYHQFQQSLEAFKDFWDQMDEIDQNSWVLEPDYPSRSCTTRRIALGSNASIHIVLNPSQPRILPECRFLGADNVIIPLRERLNTNIQSWDPSTTVLSNLASVLGQKFPSPLTTKKEDFSMECGICYAYRLNDTIPDKACDDSRCSQPFHSSCLYEWLKSLPNSRQSFNVIFGECPYCEKPITVKMGTGR